MGRIKELIQLTNNKEMIWDKTNDRRIWQGAVLWICVAATLVHLLGVLKAETWSLRSGSMMMERLCFSIVHANVLHLALNITAMLSVAFKMYVPGWKWLCGYAISTSYPSALIAVPIVGMSGWVYAMLGLMTMQMRQWKWALGVYSLTIAMSAMIPGIAWGIHAWCYGLGILVSLAVEPVWCSRNR